MEKEKLNVKLAMELECKEIDARLLAKKLREEKFGNEEPSTFV